MPDASTPPDATTPPTAVPSPSGSPREPGETLPAQRRLPRPPGDRHRRVTAEPVLERPDTGRALMLGLSAAAGTAALTALFHAILSITAGLIAISVLGAWLIGIGVRQGAWSGRPHRPSPVPGALGAGLGLVAWVGGLLLAWLLSQAILPGSTRSLPERLAATPLLDWFLPQLGPLDLLRLAILVIGAWAAAQSARLERREPAEG